MKVLIKVPAPLRVYVENKKEIAIEVKGQTLRDALLELTEIYPNLKDRLFDEVGNMRKFLTIFINNTNAKDFEGENTRLKDGDTITILPAIAGGNLSN
ncbi:MAG: MoaD family protein [Brevinematales bacterium]|nr:MoaD family protein [Brevinematales bacterium]